MGFRAAGIVLAVAIGAVTLPTYRPSGRPDALLAADSNTEAGADGVVVGEPWYFGTGPIEARPGHQVRLTGADVVGVPDGMAVVSVRLRSSDDPGGSVGALPEHLFVRRRHTWTDLPSPLIVGGKQRPYWEFVIALKITRPGMFRTAGIEVRYLDGGRRGSQLFPYFFHLNSAG